MDLFHRRWLERVPLGELRSDTFLMSFELLQRMAERGCAFERVAVRPFARQDGSPSRELAPRRMAWVLGEIVRYRWRSLRSR